MKQTPERASWASVLGYPHAASQTTSPGPEELRQALERGADQRDLRRVTRVGAHVERHPVGTRGLQRSDLARHPAVRAPTLGNERGVLIGAGDAQRGQIDVQAPGVDAEALDRPGGQRAAQRLGVDGQRLKRAPEAVVVEQRRRDPDELLQRAPRRPAGDVIERRGRAQPAADQCRTDLARRELLATALRQRPVDRPDQIQLAQEVRSEQQRPNLAAHSRQRRVQPRERAHQLLELARRLQLVLAPQRAQHAMPHAPVLVAIGLHQAQIDVALPAPHHGVTLDVHVGPTI